MNNYKALFSRSFIVCPFGASAGFRHVRSAPASGRKSTPALADFVPFEVKMADFPELAGLLQKSTSHAGAQKDCWGPSPQCTNPQTQTTSQKVSFCI